MIRGKSYTYPHKHKPHLKRPPRNPPRAPLGAQEPRQHALRRALELAPVGVEAVGRRLAIEQQLEQGLELVAVDVARHIGGAGRGQLVRGDQGRAELDDVGVGVRVPVVAVEEELVGLQEVLVVDYGARLAVRG